MDTNLGKKMPQKIKWDVTTKYQLTKTQKEILKDYFENGPSLRSEIKKNGKKRRGKSYNENIDLLTYLNLLEPKELLTKALKIKHTDTEMIEPRLRIAVKNAFKKENYGRPSGVSRKKWEDALRNYQMGNYNKFLKDQIGELSYSLTIWGIVAHLRNEGKLSEKIGFTVNETDENLPFVLNSDLDLVLEHFTDNFRLIARKWNYLCQNNDSDVCYSQLFEVLALANYYYEVLNADFAKFERSALDDVLMTFFIPYTLPTKDAKKWMVSIVKDNETFDYLSHCFVDLQQNFKKNREIVTEYKKVIDSFRKGKNKINTKFFKKHDFRTKVPINRYRYHSFRFYLDDGYGDYHLSNFLNVLDFGPLDYRSQVLKKIYMGRKKRR